MAFPRDPRDTVVEAFINSGWVDLTASADVYGREPLALTSGRADEQQGFAPATCGFTLNNRTGKYNPRNPVGVFYRKIGRNTPTRVSIRTARDQFSRVVVNGWGTATTGHGYTLIGSGGTVQASDYQVSGGFATHSVPATNAYRASYFAPSVIQHRTVGQAITVSLPFTNVTGANIEIANLMFQVSNTPTYYQIRFVVTTAEEIKVWLVGTSGSQASDIVTIPGLTHSSSQPIRVSAQFDGNWFRAKAWAATGVEPFDWHLSFAPILTTFTAGGVGVRSGVATGNTNTLPIVFTYSDYQVTVPRFIGEISAWNQHWDGGIQDATAAVEAAGIGRRVGQGTSALGSTPRREIPNNSNLDLYLPLEDGSLVAEAIPDVGYARMRITGDIDSSQQFGQGQLAPWLPNVVARLGLTELSASGITQAAFNAAFAVSWIMSGGRAHNDVVITGQSSSKTVAPQTWVVEFSLTTDSVRLTNVGGSFLFSTTAPVLFGGGVHSVELSVSESAGQSLFFLKVDGATILTDFVTTGTLQPVETLRFRNLVDPGSNSLAIGHVTVGRTSGVSNAADGFDRESASDRLARICSEQGVPFTCVGPPAFVGGPIETAIMGPQYTDSFSGIVAECALADMGELYESRGATGLEYRTLKSLYSQPPVLTLYFSADHLAPPLDPVDDDQLTHNKVTVSRRNGGTFTAEATAGPLSTADPSAGGIGTYETSLTLNVFSDEDLVANAGWVLHLGTFDGARYPQITVSLGRPAIANDVAMANAAIDVNIGDRIVIKNASAIGVYDDISLIVRGITESIDAFEHLITFNCTPEEPYHVRAWNDSTFRWDLTDTRLTGGTLSTSGLSFQVAFDTVRWTTDPTKFPINFQIGGEVITVSAISGTTSPQTFTVSARSVNGVVKSHSVNEQIRLADPTYWGR